MQHQEPVQPLDASARIRVLDALRLLSSAKEQLDYQRTVSIADVSAELFCIWDEAFWPGSSELRAVFSEDEWESLLRFHSIIERVLRLLPHTPLPPIEKFVHSPHWRQIASAATKAMRDLNTIG